MSRVPASFIYIIFLGLYGLFSGTMLRGQFVDRSTTCMPDTVKIELFKNKHEDRKRYKAVECFRPSYFGLRLEGGASAYSFSGTTKAWFENRIVPSVGFAVAYKNLNLGVRIKHASFSPRVEYLFGREILTVNSRVISSKSDLYLGYSINAKNLVSFEPYISYSVDNFRVKNQSALGQAFNMLTARGLLGGMSINRYISIGGYEFFSVFVNLAYSMVDYSRTHPQLGKGYIEGTVGIAYKGFYEQRFLKKVE